QGGKAMGISGKDCNLIQAKPVTEPAGLGFVGEPTKVNVDALDVLHMQDIIPVVAPLGIGEEGMTYNINADTTAGAVAAATQATRFMLLTDVPGVLDRRKRLIPELTVSEAKQLIEDGVATGGMIPKLQTCIDAVEAGVEGAVIIDGRVPHAIL